MNENHNKIYLALAAFFVLSGVGIIALSIHTKKKRNREIAIAKEIIKEKSEDISDINE